MSADRPRDLGLTYEEALHGVQAATMFEHSQGSTSGSPKHLRVGVNSAMVNDAAVTRLLIARGIFTAEEYIEEVRLQMNEELARHEEGAPPGMKFR